MGAQTCCCSAEETGKAPVEISKTGDGVVLSQVLANLNNGEGKVLTLGFKRQDGSVTEIEIRRRPIGIDFDRKTPIAVKRVRTGSPAEEQGVQSGWTLTSINREELEDRDFEYQYEILRQSSNALDPKVRLVRLDDALARGGQASRSLAEASPRVQETEYRAAAAVQGCIAEAGAKEAGPKESPPSTAPSTAR
eukprot:gnl/TRDRNA2_/TRDRNA2_38941_c0_seq1.p2 gnl/TRDRNA2_/TRDRNA2_38941_c0~~gnl/TRDRNA2_/TRDRNA2_38941_c0_seq1.p2  ORF type:complete len:225 (+),score=32.37 gnl/TRDRNA2_/TRDRNA2_38941_c0_seq1:99-677(+)